MTNKKVITVTLPNAMGGVASFNRNILKYFDRQLVFIRVILIGVKEIKRVEIDEGFNCDELLKFDYSNYDNYYFVLKRLGSLIGKFSDIVITDNGLTLDALSITNIKAIVHYLNHDFYYVKQVLNHSKAIDYSISHSQFFNDCLASADFNAFENKLVHLPYGVPVAQELIKSIGEKIKLVYLGRFEHSKGVLSLIDIDNELKNRNIEVDWLLIGDGALRKQVHQQWAGKENIKFQQPSTTSEVYELLLEQDILVFPSLFEGTPVAIFEAISCGCVPVVYNIPGGVREFLSDDFSIKVKAKDIASLTAVLINLQKERETLRRMQKAAFKYSNECLDESKINPRYFEFIYNAAATKTNNSMPIQKLSILDKNFVPNQLSRMLKQSKKLLSKTI